MRAEKRESGAEADIKNSGATLAYLSPDFSYRLGSHWDALAFVQLPVYQRVNGQQIKPDELFSTGLQYRL